MTRLPFAAALLALSLAVSGCVVEPANPYPAPPAPRVEAIPPPPGGMVWEPGRYEWNGGAYVWVPGHYVRRLANMNHWQPAHWENHGGTWVWVKGRWI